MTPPSRHYDVIVVGSGFGGSVCALRLSQKGYRVGILEAGRRWDAEDFPRTNWHLWKSLWFPKLGMKGIQRISLLRDVLVLSGSGVGGGSLVYANTHYEPLGPFYTDPQWSDVADWESELAPHFAEARRMLGVTTNPADTAADDVVRAIGRRLGVEDTFEPTPVAVFLGEPGVEVPDPYFDGEGPSRTGCIGCGNCMVGCRFNAKNTLDKNYLWFAERLGASVHPEHEVVDLERTGDTWRITASPPGTSRRRMVYSADHVIMAAGALGTTRLLLELQERGRLPNISDRLGHQTRTNSEAIVGAISRTRHTDYSRGVAITSSIHPSADTHIEPVRYGRGSNALGLLATILVDGSPTRSRQAMFLREVVRHPLRFVRSLSVWHWSERSIMLLVMQSRDNSLRLFRKRTLFGSRLTSEQGHGEPNPTWIPVGNEAARIAADEIDGFAAGSINDALLDRPITAHILGGAAIGSSPESGVIDGYHRVYGTPDLHVVDGAAIGANLGVNPSLTITAMAERAMSFWPNRGEADQRPPVWEATKTG